ncbi:Putative PotC-like ABC transporter permease [Candidatus Bealeia paramacronuclearis]|uniref:PotC-like ABC transporter permease n=1 Tax=Candidatus Bealeia paramacronuclearis TaxID=1921001 RepID=A0ABZ2C274_9PROT|nr:putative PotC-like ABC transporter permease [Candidatus Bealeia paramacronuclearis]
MRTKRSWPIRVIMVLGYSFLYLPIISLVIFSFNDSKQVTVWTSFSLKWYESLLQNQILLDAAGLSLKVAFLSAFFAVVLGTLSAVGLVRWERFRGRGLFSILTAAPLVMPEVITGLALLLLFVTLDQTFGWPSRGITTITIAHTTLCLAYVAIIVRTRLSEMDPTLEEAALDLGAKPLKVFFAITLPIISPALISGWLLAFVLSLDDLVIASFVAGPGSSTLPMVIFSSVRYGMSPEINALATIIITFVAIGVMIAGYILQRHSQPR